MTVSVDEARNENVVGGVDNRDVAGRRDRRAHLADFAVLDQDVGLRKIANLAIEREYDSAFDENAPRTCEAREVGIGGLCDARCWQQWDGSAGGGERR